MSKNINVTDGSVLETINNKVDLDGGNYPGSGLSRMINVHHTGINMFDPVVKDHILTYEESRGLALQGTWVYKTAAVGERYGYPDFYAKCIDEYLETQPDWNVPNVKIYGKLKCADGVLSGIKYESGIGILDQTIYRVTDYAELSVLSHLKGTIVTDFELFISIITPRSFSEACIFYSKSHHIYIESHVTKGNMVFVTDGIELKGPNIAPDTQYTFIFKQRGNVVEVEYSTDGINFTPYCSGERTESESSTGFATPLLGIRTVMSSSLSTGIAPFKGAIDIKGAYLNINNERVWDATLLRKHANGHVFYDVAGKDLVDEFLTSDGAAWYYGIDTRNERVFLPRDNYFAVQKQAQVQGTGKNILFTDGTASLGIYSSSTAADGVRLAKATETDNFLYGTEYGVTVSTPYTGTNLSLGLLQNPEYSGVEATLLATEDRYLYICVGNLIADTSWIDVVTQVQSGTHDIENCKNNSLADIEATTSANMTALDVRGAELRSKMALQMFDTISKDHILSYEEMPGLALQGTAVYKNAIAGERYGYPDFYNKCLLEYQEGQDITINGATCRKHPNGHIYYEMKDKQLIDQEYINTGVGHFYGIDTMNERIYLPRVTERRLVASSGLSGDGDLRWYNLYSDGWCEQGAYAQAAAKVTTVTLEIPYINQYAYTITESIGGVDNTAASNAYSQVYKPVDGSSFTISGYGTGAAYRSMWKAQGYTNRTVEGSTQYVYFCVGNTPADTSWIDVVTQVNGGVKDLADKTNEGLSALANASNTLRNTQIANCLLEVPQNLKLELNDGVLTLKAGSKVIMPNGFEADGTTPKFDEVIIKEDSTFGLVYDKNETMVMYIRASSPYQSACYTPIGANFSSATPPDASSFDVATWYDTTENKVKRSVNGGATWKGTDSFPICIFKTSDTADANGLYEIASIDQVFNGFGYIGSTVWVDKGVKGLIPNGRNEDGTLNNREITTSKVSLSTVDCTCHIQFLINEYGIMVSLSNYFDEEDPYHYDEDQNYLVNANGDRADVCWVGDFDRNSGVVSNFQIKRPFRALDRSEVKAYVVDTYHSGTSWYRIWSDGWCEQGGVTTPANNATKTVTLHKPYRDTNYSVVFGNTYTATASAVSCVSTSTKATTGFTMFDAKNAAYYTIWETRGYIKL